MDQSRRPHTRSSVKSGDQFLDQSFLIDGRFGLTARLAATHCGVYSGYNVRSKKKVVVKIYTKVHDRDRDGRIVKFDENNGDLIHEFTVYSQLANGDVRKNKSKLEEKGIPAAYYLGESPTHHFLVVEMMGDNLLQRLRGMGANTFTALDAGDIGLQAMTAFEYIQDHHFIHKDIKPDNIVLGADNSTTKVYIIDFGLADYFEEVVNNVYKHIDIQDHVDCVGHKFYVSQNLHRGILASRRDDLISLGYTLIKVLKGVLPWEDDALGPAEVMDEKLKHTNNGLCQNIPNGMLSYMNYVTGLKYPEKPDYATLSSYFEGLGDERSSLDSMVRHHSVMKEMLPCTLQLSSDFTDKDEDDDVEETEKEEEKLSDADNNQTDFAMSSKILKTMDRN